MRRSDRAGMGPEANDHTWCLPRLLAAPGWGLRHKTFSSSLFSPPVLLASGQIHYNKSWSCIKWRLGPIKLLLGIHFFGLGPSFLMQGSPDHMGKRELVGEGETKMSNIGWPKTSPACGGWRASPLFLTRARARARMWLTRTGQDQAALQLV